MDKLSNPELIRIAHGVAANLPKSSILIFDQELRYVFAGGEELKKLNYDSAEMVGKTLFEVIPPERAKQLETFYKRALNKEKFQTKIVRDGFTFLVTFSHLEVGQDKTLFGLVVSQNITELVTAEKELEEQKELYENVVQGISAGIWYWPDVNKQEEWWSDRYYDLLGYKSHEIPATLDNFAELIHPDDRTAAFDIQKKHFVNESTFYIEYRVKTKHQGYRWFLGTGKVITDENGKAKSMVGSIIDINDRKQAEYELIEAEMKLTSMFNNSFQLISLFDAEGRMVESNYIAQEYFGETINSLRGQYLWDIGSGMMTEGVREQQIAAVNEALQGKSSRLELRYDTPNGVTYQDFSIKPILNVDGKVAYLIAELRDITDMVLARKNLEEQKFQLENFAYITSHNLRAPAANISMLIEMLEYLTDEDDRKDLLNQINFSAQKLIDTISILATIVKIRKDVSLPTDPVNLEQMLKTVKNDLSASIKSSGAVIEADFTACPTIKFPIAYMESIFANMLSNSIKYASPQRPPHIIIKSHENGGRAMLEFIDNGIGIDLDKHGHKVFGLYKVFTKHTDAHGVGLYLVKNQVESQGGTISVESVLDVGSRFTITF